MQLLTLAAAAIVSVAVLVQCEEESGPDKARISTKSTSMTSFSSSSSSSGSGSASASALYTQVDTSNDTDWNPNVHKVQYGYRPLENQQEDVRNMVRNVEIFRKQIGELLNNYQGDYEPTAKTLLQHVESVEVYIQSNGEANAATLRPIVDDTEKVYTLIKDLIRTENELKSAIASQSRYSVADDLYRYWDVKVQEYRHACIRIKMQIEKYISRYQNSLPASAPSFGTLGSDRRHLQIIKNVLVVMHKGAEQLRLRYSKYRLPSVSAFVDAYMTFEETLINRFNEGDRSIGLLVVLKDFGQMFVEIHRCLIPVHQKELEAAMSNNQAVLSALLARVEEEIRAILRRMPDIHVMPTQPPNVQEDWNGAVVALLVTIKQIAVQVQSTNSNLAQGFPAVDSAPPAPGQDPWLVLSQMIQDIMNHFSNLPSAAGPDVPHGTRFPMNYPTTPYGSIAFPTNFPPGNTMFTYWPSAGPTRYPVDYPQSTKCYIYCPEGPGPFPTISTMPHLPHMPYLPDTPMLPIFPTLPSSGFTWPTIPQLTICTDCNHIRKITAKPTSITTSVSSGGAILGMIPSVDNMNSRLQWIIEGVKVEGDQVKGGLVREKYVPKILDIVKSAKDILDQVDTRFGTGMASLRVTVEQFRMFYKQIEDAIDFIAEDSGLFTSVVNQLIENYNTLVQLVQKLPSSGVPSVSVSHSAVPRPSQSILQSTTEVHRSLWAVYKQISAYNIPVLNTIVLYLISATDVLTDCIERGEQSPQLTAFVQHLVTVQFESLKQALAILNQQMATKHPSNLPNHQDWLAKSELLRKQFEAVVKSIVADLQNVGKGLDKSWKDMRNVISFALSNVAAGELVDVRDRDVNGVRSKLGAYRMTGNYPITENMKAILKEVAAFHRLMMDIQSEHASHNGTAVKFFIRGVQRAQTMLMYYLKSGQALGQPQAMMNNIAQMYVEIEEGAKGGAQPPAAGKSFGRLSTVFENGEGGLGFGGAWPGGEVPWEQINADIFDVRDIGSAMSWGSAGTFGSGPVRFSVGSAPVYFRSGNGGEEKKDKEEKEEEKEEVGAPVSEATAAR